MHKFYQKSSSSETRNRPTENILLIRTECVRENLFVHEHHFCFRNRDGGRNWSIGRSIASLLRSSEALEESHEETLKYLYVSSLCSLTHFELTMEGSKGKTSYSFLCCCLSSGSENFTSVFTHTSCEEISDLD